MPNFGTTSTARLCTCDERIQAVMERVIKVMDCSVVFGHRTKAEQEAAFKKGNSRKHFPDSKHNSKPSTAIDVAPWVEGQIPWNRHEYWYKLAGVVLTSAAAVGVKLRWGGDWDGDGTIVKYDSDESLNDLGHFELV